MISQIDKNGDKEITYDEWFDFWVYLLNNDLNEEAVVAEVILLNIYIIIIF